MIYFPKGSVAKSATAVKTIFEFFLKLIKKHKLSKLAILFLVRILIFKLYLISIPDNNAKKLLTDFYID